MMCPLSPGASPFTFPHTTIRSGALIAPAIETDPASSFRPRSIYFLSIALNYERNLVGPLDHISNFFLIPTVEARQLIARFRAAFRDAA